MKFNKNQALAALSIALLLSTQTKPMGVDFGIDAEDYSAPVDMALTKTEQFKQAASQAYKNATSYASNAWEGSKAANVANMAVEGSKNALGMAVNGSKGAYNTFMANPGLYTGVGAGIAAAGVLAYKKPHVAGGIAAAGIAAGTVGLIAHDNPELVKAGKEAAVNAGKSAYNYAVQNAPVAYNALTNNVVADYVKENPEIVIPAAIAGAFGAYYGYAPVKRGVTKAAKAVAPYAKKAAKVAAVVAPVAAVAAVAKYSPETLVVAKDAAINAGHVAKDAAMNAGNAVVEATKAAAVSVTNMVAENTPEFVKENKEIIIPSVAVGGFVAAKTAGPITRAAKQVNYGKVAAVAAPVAVAGLIAYDNQDAIIAGKDAAVAMGKDVVNSVMNADYAQYGQKAVDAVKPAGAFVAKHASKAKLNGSRMINAARNFDYKKMAENAGKYLAEKTKSLSAKAPAVSMPEVNVNKNAVIGSGVAVGVAATGYALHETVKASLASDVQNIEQVRNAGDETIAIEDITNPVEIRRKQLRFAEPESLVQVQTFKKGETTESNVLLNVVLPGQDEAPSLNVYAPVNSVPSKELTSSVKEAVAEIIRPIEQRPVAQNVENISTMLEELEKANKVQVEGVYAQLLEKAMHVKQSFNLTGSQLHILETDIANLQKSQGDVMRITKRIEIIRRQAEGKSSALKSA